MKQLKGLLGAVLLVTAATASAQPQGTIDFQPVSCMLGGEHAVMQVGVQDKGTLRAYFRHTGATDWCSVDGTNNGLASSVTLPKFDDGVEIEYYFVVVNGKQVVAKTPQIYKVKAASSCSAMTVRHPNMLPMECLPAGSNPVADSMAAGYSMSAGSRIEVSPSSAQ